MKNIMDNLETAIIERRPIRNKFVRIDHEATPDPDRRAVRVGYFLRVGVELFHEEGNSEEALASKDEAYNQAKQLLLRELYGDLYYELLEWFHNQDCNLVLNHESREKFFNILDSLRAK